MAAPPPSTAPARLRLPVRSSAGPLRRAPRDAPRPALAAGTPVGVAEAQSMDVAEACLKSAQSGRLDLSGRRLKNVPSALMSVLPSLTELSLAGNDLKELPLDFVRRASSMRKLNLAGNAIARLPDNEEAWRVGLGSELEGLWLHGNRLKVLPRAVIASCRSLEVLSVAGNDLEAFGCDDVPMLPNLRQLNVSGNRISHIPDGAFEHCTRIVEVSAHGNLLESLPTSLATGAGATLRNLFVQGNRLHGALFASCAAVPSHGWFPMLEEMSVADNALTSLMPDCVANSEYSSAGAYPHVAILHAYGNRLTNGGIPVALLQSARTADGSRRRRQLYVESNADVDGTSLARIARSRASNGSSPGLVDLTLGVDDTQTAVDGDRTADGGVAVIAGPCHPLSHGQGGYFKVVPLSRLQPDVVPAHNRSGAGASQPRMLVVTFASAPGLPNWGGVLGRIAGRFAAAETDRFDVCFVCDARRSWYASPAWARNLGKLMREGGYAGALLLGDSMGATGSVMCAGAASDAIGSGNVACVAFCPQVDLTRGSIRPFEDPALGIDYETVKSHLFMSARHLVSRGGALELHCGTWEHDAEQAQGMAARCREGGAGGHVNVTVHGEVHDHRVAYALESDGGRLSKIVQDLMGRMLANSGST